MYLFESKQTTQFTRVRDSKIVSYKRTKTINHFRCNNCNTEFQRQRNGRPRNSNIHYCEKCESSPETVEKTRKTRKDRASIRAGETRIGWNGYKEIFVVDDLYRKGNGWRREHIIVMENFLGKKIPKGMVVHHIDNDKTNNNLSNLILCTTKEHNRLHGKIEKVVFDLYKLGIVGFDKNKLEYYII